jgi:alkylation response protein AidB-like acyl-CoA dehydrogenase
VLEDKLPLTELRRFVNSGAKIDEALWRTATELGWTGLAVPEHLGGTALGFEAQGALYEELGRHLAPLPLLSSALCAEALVRAGSEAQQQAWLPPIAEDGTITAIASPADALDGRVPTLTRSGAGFRLSGEAAGLLSPAGARLVIAFAKDESGAVFAMLLEPERDGFTIELDEVADLTRHRGQISFGGLDVPKDRLLAGDGRDLAEGLLQHAALGIAFDSIGGASHIFDLTIEYLKTRQQFGRPIGSFQALKHRSADLKVLLEASGATVRDAANRVGAPDAAYWASMAKFYGSDAYAKTAGEAIQLHGGIGYTWEHHCHLFLKRAKLNQQLFGASEWHRDRAARLLVGGQAA